MAVAVRLKQQCTLGICAGGGSSHQRRRPVSIAILSIAPRTRVHFCAKFSASGWKGRMSVPGVVLRGVSNPRSVSV